MGTHSEVLDSEAKQVGHKRSRSRSEMGGKASMVKRPWKLDPYHVSLAVLLMKASEWGLTFPYSILFQVFEHHDRIGPDTTPLITAIKTSS